MVRRRAKLLTLATLALLGARTASADAFRLTGKVEQDFPNTQGNGVTVIADNPRSDGSSNPADVAQSQWMTDRGWTSGWNIKDVRLKYDAATDTMAVGVNFFGVAGDADGDGAPGGADAKTTTAGGVDLAHLGGRESITIGIDTNNSGKPAILAGVPGDKATAGPGIDGFNVAKYKESNQGIAFSYGETLKSNLGELAFDPSSDHPGFEFTIKNFKTLPGLDPSKGFGITAFAGSPDDVVAGEDYLPLRHISMPEAQVINRPEPATLLAWSLMAGGAAWRFRRRRHLAA